MTLLGVAVIFALPLTTVLLLLAVVDALQRRRDAVVERKVRSAGRVRESQARPATSRAKPASRNPRGGGEGAAVTRIIESRVRA